VRLAQGCEDSLAPHGRIVHTMHGLLEDARGTRPAGSLGGSFHPSHHRRVGELRQYLIGRRECCLRDLRHPNGSRRGVWPGACVRLARVVGNPQQALLSATLPTGSVKNQRSSSSFAFCGQAATGVVLRMDVARILESQADAWSRGWEFASLERARRWAPVRELDVCV